MSYFNKKDDKPNYSSYIDGMSVRISEKYRPPRRVTLPVSLQHMTAKSTLAEDYDFKLETSVLQKMPEWRKARLEERNKRKDRIKNKQVCDEIKTNLKTNLTITNNTVISDNHTSNILNPILSDTLLQPVHVNDNVKTTTIKKTNSFNISDFESDNSSPFDNMELKTINDMEMLAKILSNTQQQGIIYDNNISQNQYQTDDYNFVKNDIKMDWKNKNGFNNLPNGYFSSHQYQHNVNYPFVNYQFTGCGQQQQSDSHNVAWQAADQYNHVVGNETPSTLNQSQKSTSRSVPDIVQELNNELKQKKELEELERKTKTPPPRPISFESRGLENWKPWPDLESPSHTNVNIPTSSSTYVSNLADPTDDLTPSVQRLARHICEMGFPLPRVSRACQTLGPDDKKIIEFLLQAQTLEEKNYPGDLVEKALVKNNFNEEATENYITTTLQLLDLGFDENKIDEALARTDNDRDKALDWLIS